MEIEDAEVRAWIDELAAHLVSEPAAVVAYILARAKAAADDGTFPLPGRDAEESRALNATLLHRNRLGLRVAAPEGGEEDDLVIEARSALVAALRDEGLPDRTDVTAFTLGVGYGTGAAIIATVAGIITILEKGPAAWKNVKRWAAAMRKAVTGSDHAQMNLETLKLICVDDVLTTHENLAHLDPELIAATVALGTNPDTDEEEILGPVYVVIPVREAGMTYFYVINWDGTILHRTSTPFFGSDVDELEARTDERALGAGTEAKERE
jgi:hypothetical protein